ncbi:MAG: hypothetical protein Kow0063_34610 [Anaerolineae bacterium]
MAGLIGDGGLTGGGVDVSVGEGARPGRCATQADILRISNKASLMTDLYFRT